MHVAVAGLRGFCPRISNLKLNYEILYENF